MTCQRLLPTKLTGRPALAQSPDDVNSYFVFFSSQKDAAAAGQCIVFNEVIPGLQHQRVYAQSQGPGCVLAKALH